MEQDFKFQKAGEVRTRFAPSPTGLLHVGGVRTALFNYLFAKKHEGRFILRIEDTDLERSKPEYEKNIIESFKWLGIDWDEGPEIGGPYGPYYQRQRLDTYKKYLQKLLEEDKAYYCFCSEEKLEAQRQYQMSQGMAPRYSGECAGLAKETVEKMLKEGKPSVIRFRMASEKVGFQDIIRGKVEFDAGLMGDTVIAKDLDTPLYNFAVVVDDYEMKISHVIRGEEHLSNTPKQILLQRALGFTQPQYAHLPLILGEDRSKMSKRHEATSVTSYQKEGYLPEALINFLAFLGWNPGGEREIYSLASLVKEFELEKVQKAGAIFNPKRLDFLNGFYIRQRSPDKMAELCLPYLVEQGLLTPLWGNQGILQPITGVSAAIIGYEISETKEKVSLDHLKKIIGLYHERLKRLSEITELTDFFFKSVLKYGKELLKWRDMSDKEIKDSLENSEKILSKIKDTDWNKENLQTILMQEAEKTGDRGALLWPLRVALTGKQASAGPIDVAEILGKEKAVQRVKEAIKLL